MAHPRTLTMTDPFAEKLPSYRMYLALHDAGVYLWTLLTAIVTAKVFHPNPTDLTLTNYILGRGTVLTMCGISLWLLDVHRSLRRHLNFWCMELRELDMV